MGQNDSKHVEVFGQHQHWLVVWNMAFIFPYIGNVIIPTDELIFFRGVGQPPARKDGTQATALWSWMKVYDIQHA